MKKQTKEELEASLKKTQDELEIDKKKDEKEIEDIKKKVEPSEPIPSEPAPSEPAPSEPVSSEPVPSEPVPSPDYKEKFSESSREAQKIHAKNRKINEGVAKAGEINDVSDEELQAEYSDWDVMSETERKLAKKNLINDKRFAIIQQTTEEAKKIEKWGDDVDKFVDDPKTLIDNPELEGKQKEFTVFANEQSNHAVPFKILVGAFLHDMESKKKINKGKMFETGSGGPNTKQKPISDKISVDEAAKLMKSDYKKYKELLLAGKIEQVTE
jgi:hypothetical protein